MNKENITHMLGLTTTENARKLSDEEVLTRSLKEPWLFAVLLDRYQDAFYRKVIIILNQKENAADVVQDTVTKIYKNAYKFKLREDASFNSWAYKILLNTAFTKYQKNKKERDRYTALDLKQEQKLLSTFNHSAFRENEDAVLRILKRLPKRMAQVLHFHYLERWTHKDIAKHQNQSVGAVKSQIHRAKIAFKKQVKNNELLDYFKIKPKT